MGLAVPSVLGMKRTVIFRNCCDFNIWSWSKGSIALPVQLVTAAPLMLATGTTPGVETGFGAVGRVENSESSAWVSANTSRREPVAGVMVCQSKNRQTTFVPSGHPAGKMRPQLSYSYAEICGGVTHAPPTQTRAEQQSAVEPHELAALAQPP